MIYDLVIGGQTKRSTSGQHEVKIDFDALPDASKEFIVRYGLKQYLADGMAGASNVVEAEAGVTSRVAKLKSGDLSRVRGEGKTAVDSTEQRAIKLAKAAIRAAIKAKNGSATKEAIDEAAKKLVTTQPKWLTDAKKQLEMEAKSGEDMDLGELLASVAGNAE